MRVVRSAVAVFSAFSVVACQTMATAGAPVSPISSRGTASAHSGTGPADGGEMMRRQGVAGITSRHPAAPAAREQSLMPLPAEMSSQRRTILIGALVVAAVVIVALGFASNTTVID